MYKGAWNKWYIVVLYLVLALLSNYRSCYYTIRDYVRVRARAAARDRARAQYTADTYRYGYLPPLQYKYKVLVHSTSYMCVHSAATCMYYCTCTCIYIHRYTCMYVLCATLSWYKVLLKPGP